MAQAGRRPKMKPASDVVKRLQWDDQLPVEHFVVGYIDRFLGVLERPFVEFNWSGFAAADPEDTAIPEHRIEYFKYRSKKVWDKPSRTDFVFGSSVPQGMTFRSIIDIIRQEDENVTFNDHSSEEEATVEENLESMTLQDTPNDKMRKYAIIIPVHNENVRSLVTLAHEFLRTKFDASVRRLAALPDLHVTVAVFETLHTVDKVAGRLSSIQEVISREMKNPELRFDGLQLLKDTVVASKVPSQNIRSFADFLGDTLSRFGYYSLPLSCLHMTIARLQKPENDTVAEYWASTLGVSRLNGSCNAEKLILKEVGDQGVPKWTFSLPSMHEVEIEDLTATASWD